MRPIWYLFVFITAFFSVWNMASAGMYYAEGYYFLMVVTGILSLILAIECYYIFVSKSSAWRKPE